MALQLLCEGFDPSLVLDLAYVRNKDKVCMLSGEKSRLEESAKSQNCSIVESLEEVGVYKPVNEDSDDDWKVDGEAKFVVEGPYQRWGVRNANKRMYPKEFFAWAVGDPKSPVMESVRSRQMAGHLEHPADGRTSLKEIGLLTTHLSLHPTKTDEGKTGIVRGRSELTETPNGSILKGLSKSGYRWGVSSRGRGSVDNDGNVKWSGKNESDDFQLQTFDAVADPSTPGARPEPVKESVEAKTFAEGKALLKACSGRVETKSGKTLYESVMAIPGKFLLVLVPDSVEAGLSVNKDKEKAEGVLSDAVNPIAEALKEGAKLSYKEGTAGRQSVEVSEGKRSQPFISESPEAVLASMTKGDNWRKDEKSGMYVNPNYPGTVASVNDNQIIFTKISTNESTDANDKLSLTFSRMPYTIAESLDEAAFRGDVKKQATADIEGVEPLVKNFEQYIKRGNTFEPVGKVELKENLGRHAYRIGMSFTGPQFTKVKLKTDELYHLKDTVTESVLKEIDKFWGLKEGYEKLGLRHVRGLLLHGVPGTGKSSVINQVVEMIVERGDVVFYTSSVSCIAPCMKAFREIEPDRKVVIVLEDADGYIQYEERSLLNLMDGEEMFEGVLWLATTNYLNRFPPRLLRPGRFDKKIMVPPPTLEARSTYLQRKLKQFNVSEKDCMRVAKELQGLSFGHLKEYIASVYAMGEPEAEVIERLKGEKHLVESSLTMNENFADPAWREETRRSGIAAAEQEPDFDFDPLATSESGDEIHAPGTVVTMVESTDEKLGDGSRFKSLTAKLKAKGSTNPAALAAWIGRKKYGAKKFNRLAHEGTEMFGSNHTTKDWAKSHLLSPEQTHTGESLHTLGFQDTNMRTAGEKRWVHPNGHRLLTRTNEQGLHEITASIAPPKSFVKKKPTTESKVDERNMSGMHNWEKRGSDLHYSAPHGTFRISPKSNGKVNLEYASYSAPVKHTEHASTSDAVKSAQSTHASMMRYYESADPGVWKEVGPKRFHRLAENIGFTLSANLHRKSGLVEFKGQGDAVDNLVAFELITPQGSSYFVAENDNDYTLESLEILEGTEWVPAIDAVVEGKVNEKGIARIFRHMDSSGEKGYAILSADRHERSEPENKVHRKALENHLRKINKGFTHVIGGYVEHAPTGETKVVREHSYFVPGVSRKDARALAKHAYKAHGQEAILHGHSEHGAHLIYHTGKREKVGDQASLQHASTYFTAYKNRKFGMGDKVRRPIAASVGNESMNEGNTNVLTAIHNHAVHAAYHRLSGNISKAMRHETVIDRMHKTAELGGYGDDAVEAEESGRGKGSNLQRSGKKLEPFAHKTDADESIVTERGLVSPPDPREHRDYSKFMRAAKPYIQQHVAQIKKRNFPAGFKHTYQNRLINDLKSNLADRHREEWKYPHMESTDDPIQKSINALFNSVDDSEAALSAVTRLQEKMKELGNKPETAEDRRKISEALVTYARESFTKAHGVNEHWDEVIYRGGRKVGYVRHRDHSDGLGVRHDAYSNSGRSLSTHTASNDARRAVKSAYKSGVNELDMSRLGSNPLKTRKLVGGHAPKPNTFGGKVKKFFKIRNPGESNDSLSLQTVIRERDDAVAKAEKLTNRVKVLRSELDTAESALVQLTAVRDDEEEISESADRANAGVSNGDGRQTEASQKNTGRMLPVSISESQPLPTDREPPKIITEEKKELPSTLGVYHRWMAAKKN